MNRDTVSTSPWVPVQSGQTYRVQHFPVQAYVTPQLAGELEQVLERFGRESGFTQENPIGIVFKPGTVGHHQVGRAADIYAVGGRGLDAWKARWDQAVRAAAESVGSINALLEEQRRNLGWRLYKALQGYGRWSQPYGYPIQLFGPWTRSEGPWKFISNRLLYAHRDHIHIAK